MKTPICGRCEYFGGTIGSDGPCSKKRGAIVNWAAACEKFDPGKATRPPAPRAQTYVERRLIPQK